MSTEIDSVDEVLPVPRLLALGLQHVLVLYAGAVAVPLIIGRALKLPPEDVAFLISADLFACGLATLVQCVGFPGVGIRLPVMMGVTFASIGPMLSMAAAPEVGLLGIYGSVIAAGIFGIVVAPFISRLLPLFPPVVTGSTKLAALVEAVPVVVLGGAGLVMFGMVAATGARILTSVDFRTNRFNLFVVAISVGFGLIPLAAPGFFHNLPRDLQPLLESGILLCAVVAVVLNAFFNGLGGSAAAEADAAGAAAPAPHA
jgi:xanthine/uracil permease